MSHDKRVFMNCKVAPPLVLPTKKTEKIFLKMSALLFDYFNQIWYHEEY